MSDTFACPHCAAKYPVKPALVGRNLRCTSCKQAFQLQGSGIALRVKSRSDNLRQNATDEDTKRHNKENLRSTKDRIADEERANRAREKAAQVKRERLRQAMAATLSKSAADALEVESSKEETRQHERKQASRSRVASQEAALNGMSVVLTGQSKQAHKLKAILVAIVAVAVALVAIFYVVMSSNSAQQQALAYYAEYPPAERQKYPERLRYYMEKMWYVALPASVKSSIVIVDIHKAQMSGPIETLSTDGAAAYIAQFKDMTHLYLDEHWQATAEEEALRTSLLEEDPEGLSNTLRTLPDIWVSKGDEELARSLWWADGGKTSGGFQLAGKLLALKKKVVETRRIPQELAKQMPDQTAAHILSHLFIGETDFKGGQAWQKALLAGAIPTSLQIQRFTGEGAMLTDTGDNTELVFGTAYQGMLLRCDGLAEADEQGNDWRVFEVQRLP